ncbi:hypothetical protein Tco_0412697 [Tanacetum coccineum]
MAVVEVPQILEYRGVQLNAALVLEVEKFTNWKKRKPKTQWTPEERKAANLDQQLKSLIMSVLLDDQMNSVINCLTAKSTWDDLILYHEGPYGVKENRVMDLKLCYNTFKFKEGESLTQTFTRYKALMNELVNDGIKLSKLEINTDSPDDEEDTRSSQEYMNDLKEEYQARALLAKSKSALAPSSSSCKNKGLIAESYDWDEEVLSDDNDVTKVKAIMTLADEERVSVGKESGRNGEWIKISMKKLLVLKQAKLNLLTMQHVNTKILKENHNLRNELKELTSITEARINSSNKVNQCISEHIPTKKKKIFRIDQLTEDTSSSGPKDPVFVKSSADNSEVSITGSNKPKLSKAKDSTLSSHDTIDESSICNTLFPPLEKLTGAEPVFGPKTIKSVLKSKSTFKAETLKDIIINEPSSAPATGNTRKEKLVKLRKLSLSKQCNIMESLSRLNNYHSKHILHAQIWDVPGPEGMYGNNSTYTTEGYGYGIVFKKGGKVNRHFINKERYVKDMLRKYDKIGSSVNTQIVPPNMLGPDLNGKAVNESQYRGMIGSRMNLTTSRPDIQFSTDLYARHQAKHKESHLIYVENFQIQNHTLKRDIEFHFIPIQYQLANIFTKPLDDPTFKRLIVELVGFNLEDIILNTNNEVALLYPEHNSKDHFKCVSDFISKCCLRKPFTRSPNMYKEYLAKFWYVIGAHYLPHSSEYVAPPSIDIMRPWFEIIRYGEAVLAKGTLKKSLLPPRWRLLME